MGSPGPAGHGLARFTAELECDWRYPRDLPQISDCYALTLTGETAWICAYTDFHLISPDGRTARDHGRAPFTSCTGLLVDGDEIAQLGAHRVEYDLVRTARVTPNGVIAGQGARRLVLPDGLEINRHKLICRGATVHLFAGRQVWTWRRSGQGGLSWRAGSVALA